MALAFQLTSNLSTQIQETFQHLYQLVDEQYTHTITTIKTQQRRLKLKQLMRRAKSYTQWKAYALEYDSLKNVKNWRKKPTDAYDWKYIKHLTDTLRTLRSCGEYKRVIHVIRSTCSRNIGNILNPELYSKTYIGTKAVIEDYQTEVLACLDYISKLPDSQLPRDRKLEFFAESRHAYGRTALLLSGGGGLGIYHYGVIKTLIERDVFPKVIAGSSAGSMFAALIGITKPDEFHKLMKPECINFSAFDGKPEELSLWRKIKRFFKEGQLLDKKLLIQFLRDNLGDITFQQAYDKTGLILNITVTGYDLNDGNHVLNYLTSPNVLIWSAVMASCSLPYLFGAIPLYCKNEHSEIVPYGEMGKKFVDGSLGADVPTQKIAELFNVNFFVVSQVNPWVIPFMDHSESHRHSKRIFFLRIWEYFKTLIISEVVHRVNQFRSLGLFPAEPSRYLNLITQTYTGHTTISPVPHFTEILTILKNPSFKRLCEGEKWGARITYPKMNRIETAMTIEKSLELNHQKAKKNFFRKRTQLQEVLEEYEPHRSVPLEPNSGTDLPSAYSDRLDHRLPRSLSDDEC